MKKGLVISIFISVLLIMIKFYTSDYKIEYKISNYDIVTKYEKEKMYFEIKEKDKIYNFEIYMKRNLSKTRIEKIKTIEDEMISCIYPVIENIETYPLCYENGIYTDYNLINSDLLLEYKKENNNSEKLEKDFVYFNNLNDNEYIALWNYKGYTIMNGKSYKNIDLFNKDKYDNSISYLLNDTIYTANYNEEHEYSKLIALNVKNYKKSEIEIGYNIDYDSYIVGHIKKKLYIFDNKHSKLYEIDLRKQETKIIANNEIGYKKYNGKEFIKCSKSEYKVDKIKFNKEIFNYKYSYENGLFKTIKENNNIKQLINKENIKVLKENNNKIYYSLNNNFYTYDPLNGETNIFYNYELAFNNNNEIFIYLDN